MLRIVFAFLILSLISGGPLWAQCQLPEGFDHSVSTVDGDLLTTVATPRPAYGPGEVVEFVLIVENTGATAVTLNWPVTHPDAVLVAPTDCADIDDCVEGLVYSSPDPLMYIPGSEVLAPGECRVRTMAWDLAAEPAAPGNYAAWGGLMAWSLDPGVDPVGNWAVAPALLPLEISDTVAVDAMRWGELKAHYLD